MKKQINVLGLFILFLICTNLTLAQTELLTSEYKAKTIERLSELIDAHYVFPEIAKNTSARLKQQLKQGEFDQYLTDEEFAAALTESVQSINHDEHMRIRVKPPYQAQPNTLERKIEERMDQINWFRKANSGVNKVEILEGNVGYLDLREFAGFETDMAYADAYMKLLSRTDAIIIDLRNNGGGSPFMVQYLCSYFFDKKLHLNSLYFRDGDRTDEFWTLDKVGGTKMPDVPLFIITSDKTFSGAEEFSYNMKTQKRATLIGQTTGGGANPGGTMDISENLNVFIPGGKAINPITKTNWEGTGVVPEIETSPEMAFEKAYSLAKDAAEANRAKVMDKYTRLYTDFDTKLGQFKPGHSETELIKSITVLKDEKLISEWEINILGYENLNQNNKPELAELLFKTNTALFPNSPNAFDSYAEALMHKGDLNGSIENYQKAVELAMANDDPNLEAYQKNLETVKTKVKLKD